MSSTAQDALMSSSSVESEAIAAVATINMSVDNVQNAGDGEDTDFARVMRERSRQRKTRGEEMRKRIADNGFALRKNANGRIR